MILRRAASLVLAVAAVAGALATAGCGIGGGGDEDPSFTSRQVVDHVLRRAGIQLVPSRDSPVGIEILQLPDELREVFGLFEVYVLAEDDLEDTLEGLVGDGEPDDRGIYWTRDQNEGWVAHSRYGANVVVAWFDAPRKDVVDERWQRLDELMEALPSDS